MRTVLKFGLSLALVLVLSVALFVAFVSGVGGLYPHDHGQLSVSVDGEEIDFDRPEYHDRHPTFHFHEGGGQVWHHHPESPTKFTEFEHMTVEEAMATLDIEVTASSVTIDGTTYDDADPGSTVTITMNGESADPAVHRLHDGDAVEIRVVTD